MPPSSGGKGREESYSGGLFRKNWLVSVVGLRRENLSLSIDPLERRGLWFSVNRPFRKKRSLGLYQ